MSIFVNNTEIPNGGELYINGEKPVNGVYVNGTLAWENTIAPSPIQNLTATANRVGEILVTFTHSTGVPTPQHDLYQLDGTLLSSNISSGHIRTIQGGDYNLFVRAHNVAGSIDSNTAFGRSQVAAGDITREADDPALVLPVGVNFITVCMCGGGGGGAGGSVVSGGGGGGAGSGSISWSSSWERQTLSFVQGLGGLAAAAPTNPGEAGSASTLVGGLNLVAVGAPGGTQFTGGIGVNGGGNGGNPAAHGFPSSGCGGVHEGGNSFPNANDGGGGGGGGYGYGGSIPNQGSRLPLENGGGGGAGRHFGGDYPAISGANGRLYISWLQH